jgi:hypothetical protein
MRTFDGNELSRRVDEVLYYVWDPIGISHEPCARWEYKSYVPGVLQALIDHDEVQPISDHLAFIIRDNMGESPDIQKCNKAAVFLLRHKSAIKQGLA